VNRAVVFIKEVSGASGRPLIKGFATQGLYGLRPRYCPTLDYAALYAERLRYLLWNGYARRGLPGRAWAWPISPASSATSGGPAFEEKTTRLAQLCEELQTYIWNNREVLIDYGQRRCDGKPISTAGAEGTVNQLVNARLNRGDQMRWSARGAHRVPQVRAAVLDGRLQPETPPAAAA
jgi:hypothetical protein